MINRAIALAAALLFTVTNAAAQPNNPAPQPAAPTAAADPAMDAGVRKLSRRERKDRIAALGQKYRDFLRDVEPIMLDTELNTFLVLESDAQRDAYIEDFWRRRDPDPRTAYNEFRENYAEALIQVKQEFKNMVSDRSRVYLAQGRPGDRVKADCRLLQPLELWRYDRIADIGRDTWAVFYQPRMGQDYRLWQPISGRDEDWAELINAEIVAQYQNNPTAAVNAVFRSGPGGGSSRGMSRIEFECQNGREILNAIYSVQMNRMKIGTLFEPPKVVNEDVNRILRTAVIANPTAQRFEAEMTASYPGKRGARTAVELSLKVPAARMTPQELEGSKFYNLDVTGEVLKDGKLFESFHYRYNFPAEVVSDTLPVVIERYLRPADYQARIKVLDVNSGAEAIVERELKVPQIADDPNRKALAAEGSATIRMLQEDVERDDTRLRIVPLSTDLLTGHQTIETILSGEKVKAVEFYLDGKKVMVKRAPPYALQLDFGAVPNTRTVKVVGLDAQGNVITGDELVVNTGLDPFRVRIVSPRIAPKVSGNIRVELDAAVPEGQKLQSIELFLNETKLATLFSPPYIQTISVPPDLGIAYLRAVAKLADDEVPPVEDVVFINTPDFLQQVDVHLVELPTSVLGSGGRFIEGLKAEAFTVYDEGEAVKLAKFEYVENLPLSVGLAIDTSGSMKPRMAEAQKAGAAFFKNVLRPGDKAFLTGFDKEPVMLQKWTRGLSDLHAGLASLRAEDMTALYDAIVFSLYNFQGIKGQKALIVISDGRDTSSKFSFDQAIEYARRASIPIYGIGIGIKATDVEARYKFSRFSQDTGGSSWFIEKASDLSRIYDEIQKELRSQYMLSFYPPAGVKPGDKWRDVRVDVAQGKAKTIRGYYP
jgi:Ca-activated chloride channel homolog